MQTSPSGSRFQCTCSQIKYNTKLPYPQSRNKLVSCLHENFVYIYAGKDGTISLKDFWRFNIGKEVSHHMSDKTNKMTFAPSDDSDKPRHPPSLIRVFDRHSVGS